MSAERQRALDPEVARRVASLSFSARRAVDGLLTGVHKSPHRGASVVFVEHREYKPGDDLRLLDWRAYARSDRHQIKRFEQETHLRATLVFDRSGSMAYGGEGRATKAEHDFQRPEEFDIFRERKPHIGFGHGAHVCLGMHLARLESTVIFNTLLDRLPGLRLDPDAAAPYVAGMYFRSPPYLHVVWD